MSSYSFDCEDGCSAVSLLPRWYYHDMYPYPVSTEFQEMPYYYNYVSSRIKHCTCNFQAANPLSRPTQTDTWLK
jgi:hypothetical protein